MAPAWCVVDLETTALAPARGGSTEGGEVIALGAVAVAGADLLGEFETTVRPSLPWTPARTETARKYAGLTPALLKAAPDRREAREAFLRWVAEQHGLPYHENHEDWKARRNDPRVNVYLTSWNLAFDKSFLESLEWSLGWFLESQTHTRLWWGPCIQEAASAVFWESGDLERAYPDGPREGEIHWCSLKKACEFLGIEYDPGRAHGPLYDAQLAATVAARLEIGPPVGPTTDEKVERASLA